MLYAVDTKGESWKVFETKTMPTNFLIDKGGKIVSIASRLRPERPDRQHASRKRPPRSSAWQRSMCRRTKRLRPSPRKSNSRQLRRSLATRGPACRLISRTSLTRQRRTVPPP